MVNKVKVRVTGYDEGADTISLTAFGFTPEDQAADPEYCKSAPDFDDFTLPGILVPALLGEYGEPTEFQDRVFEITLP